MRVVVIGASGQLGFELMRAFAQQAPVGVDRRLFDIENASAILALIAEHRPDLIVNTAAFHNVDACETQPDRAFAVNALAVDRLAAACAISGTALAHISTDYVFDGAATTPYPEDAVARPVNAYGISKLAGELLARRHLARCYIFRTSGLYGLRGSASKGPTFVERVLATAERGDPLRVVTDITFSPSYARHVAEAVRRIVETERFGTYHVTNGGACTWYEFAKRILATAGIDARIDAVTSQTFASLAKRPAYSALAHTASELLGLEAVPGWQDGIAAYLDERGAAR